MKRWNRLVAILLAVALVLPSVLVASVPASAAESNWIVSGGSTPSKILSETSETWIVDTVTVEFGKQTNGKTTGGYIQSTQKMTDLIGHGGADGRGYVHVLVEDGSVDTQKRTYFYVQLTGSSDTSATIHAPNSLENGGVSTSTAGMTWYIDNDGTRGRIAKNHGINATQWGLITDIASRGYKMAFTEIDGQVIPRSIDNGSNHGVSLYNGSLFGSDMTLADIGGEDGVYVRFQTQTGSFKLKCTFTIAYPKPANYDYNESHWVAKGGSKILSESTETWKLDTAKVELDNGEKGYVQHKQKMTELIGNNNTDGRGWVNLIVEDGTVASMNGRAYEVIQLVGDSDASDRVKIIPNDGISGLDWTNGMSWYVRTNDANNVMVKRPDKDDTVGYIDSTVDKALVAASGFRFAFTRDEAGYVTPRAIGLGASSSYFGYGSARGLNLQSPQTLAELPVEDGGTGEDGVYVRFQTKGSSSRLKCTASVFYPVSDIESVQPEITDSITLHWTAMLAETPTVAPVMKFAMEGKEEVTVIGKPSGNSRWTFAYTDILPQDLNKNIVGLLYDGEGEDATLLGSCVYSMETYCRNKMINNTANKDNTALWTVLLNMLDYGAEAQTYFGEESTLVNANVREAFVQGYHASAAYPIPYTTVAAQLAAIDAARKADMASATGVSTLVAGEAVDGYKWQSATLSLQDYVKVRFKFTAPVDEDFKVVIGDQEYTLENEGIIKVGNSYYVYTDGISVSDFAREFTAKFYDGDMQVGQTVTYSVNTYVQWMSGQDAAVADAYNLVQALYSYSVAAVAYNA